MKPAAQLLVTVLLVAGGIFVYDAVVVRPPAEPPDLIVRTEEASDEAPDIRVEEERPPFAVLEGTGDDIWREQMERRLQELEARMPGGDPRTTVVPEGGLPSEDGEGTAGEGPEPGEPADPEEAKRRYAERLGRFRKMLEAVERQRGWEKAARQVSRFINGIEDLQLTDEQKREVVKTTVRFQHRYKQLARQPRNTEEQKQAQQAATQQLWGAYQDALRDQIPASEADVIIESIQNATSGRKDGGR